MIRRQVILHLKDLGMQKNEIADFFNAKGIKKPRGTNYQTKDIWSANKKWSDRNKRLSDTKILSIKVNSVLKFEI